MSGIQKKKKKSRSGAAVGDCIAHDEWCHAPNTFGTVNMEHTIDSSLSWSE